MKNRHLILFLVIGLCAPCLTGCMQFQYGLKQGREQRESISESARKGNTNENTGFWDSVRVGWRKQGHDWNFSDDCARGWAADMHRISSP